MSDDLHAGDCRAVLPALGWTCPGCGRCFAPHVERCRRCEPRHKE